MTFLVKNKKKKSCFSRCFHMELPISVFLDKVRGFQYIQRNKFLPNFVSKILLLKPPPYTSKIYDTSHTFDTYYTFLTPITPLTPINFKRSNTYFTSRTPLSFKTRSLKPLTHFYPLTPIQPCEPSRDTRQSQNQSVLGPGGPYHRCYPKYLISYHGPYHR